MTKYILSKGDIVVATLRNPEVIKSLAATYGEAQLLILKLDVTQPEEIVDAFAKAKAKFGRIDVVFNNAGMGILAEIEVTSIDLARKMFEVNFWGATNVTREAVRFFREENQPCGGLLIQNSSKHGYTTIPMFGFYTATKHGKRNIVASGISVLNHLNFNVALEGMSETLWKELDPAWNIKVTFRPNVDPFVFDHLHQSRFQSWKQDTSLVPLSGMPLQTYLLPKFTISQRQAVSLSGNSSRISPLEIYRKPQVAMSTSRDR